MSAIPAPPARRRRPWDAYRKISAWMGLLAFIAMIVILATVGGQLGGISGEGQAPSTTWTIIGLLSGPAVIAGIVSGSRFYALYAGYSRRLDPTDRLSPADSTQGNTVVSGYIGDGLWGSLIAGIAASIPANLALGVFLGPAAMVGLPVIALVGALAWFTGWVCGAVASMLISAAFGIAVGSASSSKPRTRLPWILIAAFLPALLISTVFAAFVRLPGDTTNVLFGLFYLLGLPLEAEFLLGAPLLIIVRLLTWLTLGLFVCLLVVGVPASLNRGRVIPEPSVEVAGDVPPIPKPPQG